MRKECVFLAMSAALLAACSNDVALDNSGTQSAETVDNAIGFQFISRNSITSRTEDNTKLLNNNGHYNFGVFAYKSSLSDGASFALNSATKVMDNYLVGYGSNSTESAAGYKLEANNQTTLGDSQWAYEKLGNEEYSNTTENNYYKTEGDGTEFYLSNNKNQYLKYWDYSTSQTDFFAYAPYLHGTNSGDSQGTAKVETSENNTVISFPMTDGYDDASKYDFIAAHKAVKKSDNNYGNEVQIDFKRLSAKIKIGFWEDIAGYKVKILNLVDATTDGSTAVGVSAAPATTSTENDATKYSYGTLYYKGTGTGTYSASSSGDNVEVSVKGDGTSGKYSNDGNTTAPKYINFVIPEGAESTNYISESQSTPSYSKTEYYLIPDNGTNQTGLTFHVTYQLKAEDTDETITVYNAKVHVPYQDATNADTKYCDWKSNYVYTYIFKITKNSTGQTDKPTNTIDPSSPDASGDKALNPIIFDGCTVEDWAGTNSSTEHNIN